MIDISKFDKADVLVALYNHARPQGFGYIHVTSEDMTKEQALALLGRISDFDYIQGRSLKVNLSETMFDPFLYDRDNGQGAAQRAIDSIHAK